MSDEPFLSIYIKSGKFSHDTQVYEIVLMSMPLRKHHIMLDALTPTTHCKLKCKILLPEFNTWKRVNPGLENCRKLHFCNTGRLFLGKCPCRYSHIVSPVRRKASDLSAQSYRDNSLKPSRFQRKADTVLPYRQRLYNVGSTGCWYSGAYENGQENVVLANEMTWLKKNDSRRVFCKMFFSLPCLATPGRQYVLALRF